MPIKILDYISENKFMICICLSIFFFLILFLFGERINKWLLNQPDQWNKILSIGGRKGVFSKLLKRNRTILKKNETKCRQIFESLFNDRFPSVRPNFLKNVTGKNLELDGYNDKLKLGFEYSGSQHYQYNPYFHRTIDDFTSQQNRDETKRRLCQINGITLIEIPYKVKYDDLETHIKKELNKIGHTF